MHILDVKSKHSPGSFQKWEPIYQNDLQDRSLTYFENLLRSKNCTTCLQASLLQNFLQNTYYLMDIC